MYSKYFKSNFLTLNYFNIVLLNCNDIIRVVCEIVSTLALESIIPALIASASITELSAHRVHGCPF